MKDDSNKIKVLILTDCEASALNSLVDGINQGGNYRFEIDIKAKVSNKLHGNLLKTFLRYFWYFIFPLKYVFSSNKYDFVLGWQQFYANNLSFYRRLLRLNKKKPIIVPLNYTYIRREGLLGFVYHKYMTFATGPKSHIQLIHLLGNSAAKSLTKVLGITKDRIFITPFGIPYIDKKDTNPLIPISDDVKPYVFSIGRSNRDFDFLVEVWKKTPELNNYTLLIAADKWQPSGQLPPNIIHRSDLHGNEANDVLSRASLMIIPIQQGNICSGDTVLLRAMSYSLPLVITKPSTLAEMYIDNNINGITLEKDPVIFGHEVVNLLKDKPKMEELGRNARAKYEANYTHQAMGRKIGEKLANYIR